MKLSGYKTYIIGFLMIVAAGCKALGYISPELFATIESLLLGGSLLALRAAVKKVE